MTLFLPIRFKTTVQISPINFKELDFDEILHKKLKKTYEGVCTRFGYIKPSSLEILKRSMGVCVKQHFNGHLRYEVICHAEVCNPAVQSTVVAIVKHKNALGIHAESSIEVDGKDIAVLDILVPRRTAGIISEINLDDVQSGDRIFVQVLTKKYQLYDKYIEVIGRAMKTATPQIRPESDISIPEREDATEEEEQYSSDEEEKPEKEEGDEERVVAPVGIEEEEEEDIIEEEEEVEEEPGADEEEGDNSDYGYE